MTIPDHFADSREAVLKARELLRRAHAVIFAVAALFTAEIERSSGTL